MWSSIFGTLQTKGFHYMTLRKVGVNAEQVLACSLQQACLQRRNLKIPPPPFSPGAILFYSPLAGFSLLACEVS